MFARCFSLLFALVFSFVNVSASPTLNLFPRIVGGQVATNSEFGYVAIIQFNETPNNTKFLSGNLIAPNIVLAEVFDYLYLNHSQPDTFYISFSHLFPERKISSDAIKASKVIIHPDYNAKTHANNIAIIILEKDVPAFKATPAKIYTGKPPTDSHVRIAGYGLTNGADPSSEPRSLMEVDVGLGSQDYCKKLSSNYNPDTMLCTDGTAGKDVCLGDWGAPLAIQPDPNFNKWDLLGFYSFKPNIANNSDYICGKSGLTSYYTYISPYVNWISREANLDVSQFTVSDSGNSDKNSNSNSSGSSKRNIIIGAVFGSVGGVLLLALAFFLYRWHRRRVHFAQDPVKDRRMQETIADEIGGAEAPSSPVNTRREDIVEYLPPVYEERDSRLFSASSPNSKVDHK